jgi:hypothetical protein
MSHMGYWAPQQEGVLPARPKLALWAASLAGIPASDAVVHMA